jgi:hypothetical protein
MAYRYFRYMIDRTLAPREISRMVGETGGVIVRVDNRDGRTEVTVTAPDDREPAATSSLGAAVEVSEDDVLNFEG